MSGSQEEFEDRIRRVLDQAARQFPVPPVAWQEPSSGDERQRAANDKPPPSRFRVRLGHLVIGASLLVVVVVGAVFVAVRGPSSDTSRSTGSPAGAASVRVVFRATPLNPRSSFHKSLEQAVAVLRHRLQAVSPRAHVSLAGRDVVVVVHKGAGVSRGRIIALTAPAQLEFYDWEANVLLPNGKTVASQLHLQDPTALTISQGTASGPGAPDAGALPLYDAVTLASKQPPAGLSPNLSRDGPQYYMFGAVGSTACTAAQGDATTRDAGGHCLLSGPDSTIQGLQSGLPPGVSMSDGQLLTVPQGTIVVQAEQVSPASPPAAASPAARFYVLKDNAALSNADIINPKQSTDQGGEPAIMFSFTSAGMTKFQHATAVIAHRGMVLSTPGQTLNQHFAVALDSQLVTVPAIDSRQYPDGITGGGGADITGGFTLRSARLVARLLSSGALPVTLTAR
jgi:SecD/SecF fusion protein